MRFQGVEPMFLRQLGLSVAVGGLLVASASASTMQPKPRPDLADIAQGTYSGDVISDARGASQSDVHVTVTKTGPNQISVKADFPRIPPRTFRLTKAMSTIQNVGGTEVFLLDLAKSPHALNLTIDDASWAGTLDQ